jgi:hypothetical protein
MAGSDTDPFATAKANLRDTVKWLSTLFSALAAASLGGASFVGLAGVHGSALHHALWGGGIGIVCLFLAAWVTLKLLTSESFHISEIARDSELEEQLNRYAIDILPPEYPSVQVFVARRAGAIKRLRELAANPDDPEYVNIQEYLQAIDEPLRLLVSLAHFEHMRLQFNRKLPFLSLFALGALAGLGVYAVYAGAAKDTKSTGVNAGPLVSLTLPQTDVPLSDVYAQACGTVDGVKAEIVGQPLSDWLTLRLVEPRECAGIVFSAPAKIVLPRRPTR